VEVTVNPGQIAAARGLKPMYEREVFGRSILLFDRGLIKRPIKISIASNSRTWRVRTPSIADVFVRWLATIRHGARSSSMNSQSNAVTESSIQSQGTAPAAFSPARAMYWSIRREIWRTVPSTSHHWPPRYFPLRFAINMLAMRRHIAASPLAGATARFTQRAIRIIGRTDHGSSLIVGISTLSMPCTESAAIAASSSGSRCRFPISSLCSRS